MQEAKEARVMAEVGRGAVEAQWGRAQQLLDAPAARRAEGDRLAEVAQDARNMVTALGLYCDLLEEPGVLAAPFAHYARVLRLVAEASRRLAEKLVVPDGAQADTGGKTKEVSLPSSGQWPMLSEAAKSQDWSTWFGSRRIVPSAQRHPRFDLLPAILVANLAAELRANCDLLCALAGPSITLTMDTAGGERPVRLTDEDLTRVLVNLVNNASDAMPGGGHIHIGLSERPETAGVVASVVLTIEDSGPGFSEAALERISISGCTAQPQDEPGSGRPPLSHRGLGLATTRSIVEGAGGRMAAGNREKGGARVEIELPVRKASI
jgi:hypothetical protein